MCLGLGPFSRQILSFHYPSPSGPVRILLPLISFSPYPDSILLYLVAVYNVVPQVRDQLARRLDVAGVVDLRESKYLVSFVSLLNMRDSDPVSDDKYINQR